MLALMGTGCGIQASNAATNADKTAKAEAKPHEEEEVIIPIQAELPRRGDVSLHFETTTRVDAENRVQVVAEAIGVCVKVVAQEGDRVKVGQLLAEIDKSEAQATLGQTEVHVRQCKTALDIAEKSLAEGKKLPGGVTLGPAVDLRELTVRQLGARAAKSYGLA